MSRRSDRRRGIGVGDVADGDELIKELVNQEEENEEYFAKLGNDVINDMPTLFDTGGVKGWSDNLVMALAVLIRKTKMASISKFRTDIGGKASFYIEIRHGERNATWALSNATTQMAYDLLDLTDLMDRRVHDSRGKIDHNVFMSIIHTVVKEYKSKGGNENE